MNIYVSYHNNDEELKTQFLNYLSSLSCSIWERSMLDAGAEKEARVLVEIEKADYIIVLLSSDLIADKKEIDLLESNYSLKAKQIIPVILRPCSWEDTWFGKLSGIPQNDFLVKNNKLDEVLANETYREIKRKIHGDNGVVPLIKKNSIPVMTIVVFGLILSIIGFQLLDKKNECYFKQDSKYHILILPFFVYSGATRNCEQAIHDRIDLISNERNLNLIVKRYKDFYSEETTLSFDEVRSIGNLCNSDLNIWGTYESLPNIDSTFINIKYTAKNKYNEEALINKKETGTKKIRTISALAQGELTLKIESIVYWALGIMAYQKGDYNLALERFEDVATAAILSSRVARSLAIGECKLMLNKFEEAINYYDQALKEDSLSVMALNNKAYALINLKKIEEAQALMLEAIRVSPKDTILLENEKIIALKLDGKQVEVLITTKLKKIEDLTVPIEKIKNASVISVEKVDFRREELVRDNSALLDETKPKKNPKKIIPSELIVIEKNEKFGLIDKEKNLVLSLAYEDVRLPKEGIAAVKRNGKWGFINFINKMDTRFIYDEIKDFSGGYAKVRKNGKWGVVNSLGKEIIIPKYDLVESFFMGLAKVKKGGKWGCINVKGTVVVPIKFEGVNQMANGSLYVNNNGIWGPFLVLRTSTERH